VAVEVGPPFTPFLLLDPAGKNLRELAVSVLLPRKRAASNQLLHIFSSFLMTSRFNKAC